MNLITIIGPKHFQRVGQRSNTYRIRYGIGSMDAVPPAVIPPAIHPQPHRRQQKQQAQGARDVEGVAAHGIIVLGGYNGR